MPIYDYHCTACGADTEVMHKISDPPAKKCPECGKPGLVKQVSASGFRLSGGGWYETDFKSGGKKNLAGEKAGDDKAGGQKAAADKPAADKSADTSSAGAKAAKEAAKPAGGKSKAAV